MSMTHTLSRALGAAVLAGSLAMAGAAAAAEPGPGGTGSDGGPGFRPAASSPGDAPPPGIASSHRSITSKVTVNGDRLHLRGGVESYAGRRVVVMRRGCESCRWRLHDGVRTNRKEHFRSRIAAPHRGSTFWRAKVEASGGFSRSFSATWETFR